MRSTTHLSFVIYHLSLAKVGRGRGRCEKRGEKIWFVFQTDFTFATQNDSRAEMSNALYGFYFYYYFAAAKQ